MSRISKSLTAAKAAELIGVLRTRFGRNGRRHEGLEWNKVEVRLRANPEKLWSLSEMERTGGEPDVVGFEKKTGEFVFFDCSEESPKGRRSVCYDRKGLESRKEHAPKNSAVGMAADSWAGLFLGICGMGQSSFIIMGRSRIMRRGDGEEWLGCEPNGMKLMTTPSLTMVTVIKFLQQW